MKRKGKESKLNVVLTSLLVVFICLLSFSIGVISGKGWSDRDYQVKYIERDSHVKAATEDVEPIDDEMTQKEVEMLTQRALEEAKAQESENKPVVNDKSSALDKMAAEADRAVASNKEKPEKNSEEKPKPVKQGDKPVKEKPNGRDASMAKNKTGASMVDHMEPKREVSSLPPQPTTPKPTAVDYTVQVAAYKTVKEAERHAEKLIDKGFPAFPVEAILKGETWYRVSIGSFKTKKRAIAYEKQLKKQAVVKNTFVQKIKRLEKK